MSATVQIGSHAIPLCNAALALGVSYLLATSSFFLPRFAGRWRLLAFIILSGLILSCPFLIPGQFRLARGAATVCIALLWMKTWDALSGAGFEKHPTLRRYLTHMLNFGLLAAKGTEKSSQDATPARRYRAAVIWFAAFIGATAILYFTFTADWSSCPFLLEHSVKAYVILVLLLCGFNLQAAQWRLSEANTYHTPVRVFLAQSPAEFWRRWNRPVGRWFTEHVFSRSGGARSPLRATLATFAVSGLMHEYVVSMFAGRVTGYPMAFCVLQGCAVAATFRFRIRGWKWLPAFFLTWAFMAVSSVLLFAPFDAGVPFYSGALPHWLRRW